MISLTILLFKISPAKNLFFDLLSKLPLFEILFYLFSPSFALFISFFTWINDLLALFLFNIDSELKSFDVVWLF